MRTILKVGVIDFLIPKMALMTLSPYSIVELAPLITGDALAPYRKGAVLVHLFNKYGFKDIYDEEGMPDIGKKNGHRPSRTEYVVNRITLLLGKPELRALLNQVLAESESPVELASKMNIILNNESFSVIENNGAFLVEGGIVDNRTPVVNEAHFQDIQDRILRALDAAEVSINIAMAWFTNETLRDKLVEKFNQGVDVYVAIFDDGINKKHGVDLSAIPHTKIRGTMGGIMHNKFCVIDNQVVITGSYNWSNNAETRNDENVTVQEDPKQATKYTLEFRRLLK